MVSRTTKNIMCTDLVCMHTQLRSEFASKFYETFQLSKFLLSMQVLILRYENAVLPCAVQCITVCVRASTSISLYYVLVLMLVLHVFHLYL